MKRAVIYCRTATSGQTLGENYGLQAQRASCLDYCKGQEWNVVETLTEVALGISLDNRPKLDEMRRMVRSGQVDAVVVHRFDRLARGNRLLVGLICEFESFGVSSFGVAENMTGFEALQGPTADILVAIEQVEREAVQRRQARRRAQ